MNITKVRVTGITCTSCEKVISGRLKRIEGIKNVQVNIASGDVSIEATRPINVDEVVKSLQGTHYGVITN